MGRYSLRGSYVIITFLSAFDSYVDRIIVDAYILCSTLIFSDRYDRYSFNWFIFKTISCWIGKPKFKIGITHLINSCSVAYHYTNFVIWDEDLMQFEYMSIIINCL